MLFCVLLVVFLSCVHSFTGIGTSRLWNLGKLCARSNDGKEEMDPNVEAHLAQWMKKGKSEDRPAPEIASELRARYKQITQTKIKAAEVVKISNPELSLELEDLAAEIRETSEKFVSVALEWDAWGRPDPDLPNQLREGKEVFDPNFEANKQKMLQAGRQDRPDVDLPSELRMLKYKNMESVKRAATEIRKQGGSNSELANELDEIASEIDESHDNFVRIAEAIRTKKYQ